MVKQTKGNWATVTRTPGIKTRRCKKCRGKGWVYVQALEVECTQCKGKGFVKSEHNK